MQEDRQFSVQNAQPTSEPDASAGGWPARLNHQPLAGRLCPRPVEPADDDFLMSLFAEARPEFGLLPEPVRDQLLRLQCDAQRRQYRADAPEAVDWILELDRGGPPERVGRCYLWQGPAEYRLLDLTVGAAWRGQGIGSAVLDQLLRAAGRAGVPLRLSVWQSNDGAVRLYRRLGFVEDEAAGGYLRMHWTPTRAGQ
jgi:ribosomal protein S18 acetylase RimI-like enzyme